VYEEHINEHGDRIIVVIIPGHLITADKFKLIDWQMITELKNEGFIGKLKALVKLADRAINGRVGP